MTKNVITSKVNTLFNEMNKEIQNNRIKKIQGNAIVTINKEYKDV